MATDLLKARLESITAARAANRNYQDSTPTLLDIEKTHILFTNAHFKPFAAIGFEYNKVNPTAGSSSLGSEITFSIPQFGDFFHDMVLYVKLKQPTLTSTAAADSEKPLMRWCPYVGERLLEYVEFEVNGNPLDKYYDDAVNFHREFCVLPNKEVGWNRCMGQEEPELGFIDQPNWANSGVDSASISHRVSASACSGAQTPSGQKVGDLELFVPLLFWCNRDVRLSVPSVAIPYGQRFIKMKLASGDKLCNLVPRGSQQGLWSDSDIQGSLTYDNMLQTIELYINNIFVNPEVHDIFIKRIGFTLIRVHRRQVFSASINSGDVLLNQLKWPIETIFVGMKMRDYNSSDVALRRQHLDKWHRFSQVNDVSRPQQGWSSNKLKVVDTAAKLFTAGDATFNNNGAASARLTATSDTAVAAVADTAIYPGDIVTVTDSVSGVALDLEVINVSPALGGDVVTDIFTVITFAQRVRDVNSTDVWGTTPVTVVNATTVTLKQRVAEEVNATVQQCVKTIDNLTIRAHGIPIYNNFPSAFYNSYVPQHYGGPNIRAPKDIGALMINFCLYPGTYQPSGHINVSRAREFYMEYTSSVIDTSTQGQLIVNAVAINFLLISDGSAVLRYST
jgi:hypothetical protein